MSTRGLAVLWIGLDGSVVQGRGTGQIFLLASFCRGLKTQQTQGLGMARATMLTAMVAELGKRVLLPLCQLSESQTGTCSEEQWPFLGWRGKKQPTRALSGHPHWERQSRAGPKWGPSAPGALAIRSGAVVGDRSAWAGCAPVACAWHRSQS